MQINLYASFREHAGEKRIDIPVNSESTVQSVIQQILITYPGLKPLWLDKQGELQAHVLISLNQVDIMALPDQLMTRVHDSDVLDFFPPIHGG